MTLTILSLTAAFACVATMLAYLVIWSPLHWIFKLAATVVTIALVPLTFRSAGELRGLPSDGPIPASFQLLWAQVVEPNILQGVEGHVFLWLQTLDAENYPVGLPRAYQLPYSEDLKIKLTQALGEIADGEEVQGVVDAEAELPEDTAEALAVEIEAGSGEFQPGGSSTVGERLFQFEPSMLTFGRAAAPVTPGKPP